jgi:peptidoglycan biosynthesis protein MviN/MurJ (putative lipid II flippase)
MAAVARLVFAMVLCEAFPQRRETVFQAYHSSWFFTGDLSLSGDDRGGAVQLLIIGIALRNRKRHIRPDIDFRSEPVAKAIRLSLPVYVGNVAGKLNNVVNRSFASLLGVGAVSSLQFAQLLVESPIRVLSSSVTAGSFFSRQFANRDSERACDAVKQAILPPPSSTRARGIPVAVATWSGAVPKGVVDRDPSSCGERPSFGAVSPWGERGPGLFPTVAGQCR